MLLRTHVAVALFVGLFFAEKFSFSPVFFAVLIFSSVLPDSDSFNSKVGRNFFSRVLTAFTTHRGILHSVLFLGIGFFVLYFYFESIALAFLIGYGLHLWLDCFTKQGVRLFYPLHFRVRGFLKSGGRIEDGIFLIFVAVDLCLIIYTALI